MFRSRPCGGLKAYMAYNNLSASHHHSAPCFHHIIVVTHEHCLGQNRGHGRTSTPQSCDATSWLEHGAVRGAHGLFFHHGVHPAVLSNTTHWETWLLDASGTFFYSTCLITQMVIEHVLSFETVNFCYILEHGFRNLEEIWNVFCSFQISQWNLEH